MSGRCNCTNRVSNLLHAAISEVYRRSSCKIRMPAVLLLGSDAAHNVPDGNRNKHPPFTSCREKTSLV